jgi:protein-tyrosine phosphatase
LIGRVTLRLFGRERRILGGSFDDYQPSAIGVCLEAGSAKAGRATIALPVADFAAPSAEALADGLVALLRAMRAAPEREVYIGCRAGLGRTGMLIAALAKLAGHGDPVGWTRLHYDPRAVETEAQARVVLELDTAAIWCRLEDAE